MEKKNKGTVTIELDRFLDLLAIEKKKEEYVTNQKRGEYSDERGLKYLLQFLKSLEQASTENITIKLKVINEIGKEVTLNVDKPFEDVKIESYNRHDVSQLHMRMGFLIIIKQNSNE